MQLVAVRVAIRSVHTSADLFGPLRVLPYIAVHTVHDPMVHSHTEAAQMAGSLVAADLGIAL